MTQLSRIDDGDVRLVGDTDGTLIGNIGDRLKVSIAGIGGTLTDRSGTTTPAVSTQIMAANTARKYLFIQNVGTDTIWISFSTAATTTQPSIAISVLSSFVMEGVFISTEAVNVISSIIATPFTAKEG